MVPPTSILQWLQNNIGNYSQIFEGGGALNYLLAVVTQNDPDKIVRLLHDKLQDSKYSPFYHICTMVGFILADTILL